MTENRMAEETQLSCVSCETTFDPTPNGGFCPDCDTPHPDYGMGEEDADAEPDEAASGDVDEADDETADEPDVSSDEEDSAGGDEEPADDDASDADEIPSVCPECGADLTGAADGDDDTEDEAESSDEDDAAAEVDEAETAEESVDEGEDESAELEECPDCGRSVTDEAFCPGCGTDLDAHRSGETDEGEESDESEETDGADEAVPQTVTLRVAGESYAFGDGETFGRQDEEWLEDLVTAAGGSDGVAYVSSEHLEFAVEDDGVYAVDVSRNGTTLNGTELDGGEAKLEDGDTLELAERAEIDVEL